MEINTQMKESNQQPLKEFQIDLDLLTLKKEQIENKEGAITN